MNDGTSEEQGTDEPPTQPGAPEPAKLRRGMFGYRRVDVDEALGTRDSELAELRQDVAALWLAFAQHDRMIREGLQHGVSGDEGTSGAREEPPPAPPADPPPSEPELSANALAAGDSSESIGRQLSDLDEVLAAIEMATQTLERTYAEEIASEADEPPPNPEREADSAERD